MNLCVSDSKEREHEVGTGVNPTILGETLQFVGLHELCLLWIDKSRAKYYEDLYMSVGVMKDKKLKVMDLHTSHTLGCAGDWNNT